MERENTVFQDELNPTFLFMWKGTRVEDEPNYHCHEHLELCYIQSGTGKHRIGDTIYEVKEGDLLVINEGVYHQSLAGEHKTPVAEFYVGLTDLNLAGLGRNHFPLPGNCPVFRTEGELQRKLSKLCMAMEAEQELCRIGRYYMMKTYAMQMLLLLLREEEETGRESRLVDSLGDELLLLHGQPDRAVSGGEGQSVRTGRGERPELLAARNDDVLASENAARPFDRARLHVTAVGGRECDAGAGARPVKAAAEGGDRR